MTTEVTDDICVAEFKSGKTDAFGILYDRYAEKIYRFVYYKIWNKEVAEDIVSDVFFKALERIHTFNPERGHFSSWLYRIARNTVIDRYRTTHKTRDIDDLFDLGHDERSAERLDAEMTLEKVSKYLEKLSPKQREIVTLRLWEELSYQEIAEIVDGTEAGVKMMFSRTIHDIRGEFGPLAVFVLTCLKP